MIHNFSSEGELPTSPRQNESKKTDNLSDIASLKTVSSSSKRQSSLGKAKVISRKPNSHLSNLESYKQIKRKSQEKIEKNVVQNRMEQPPRYPKSAEELKPEKANTEVTRPSEDPSIVSSTVAQEIPTKTDSTVRFKKKAMSKQQIIEIKGHMKGLDLDKVETNSIAASEKAPYDTAVEQNLKEVNKKSKTQYFHFEECHEAPINEADITENSSESDKIYIASLREKCKSVDDTNNLLSKRLKWLREQVEMHLERQLQFKTERQSLQQKLSQKDQLLRQSQQKNRLLLADLAAKNEQLLKLRQFTVQLNTRFDNDRQILISQIEFLKSEKDEEMQEREKKYEQQIKQLQNKIELIRNENHHQDQNENRQNEQYFKNLAEKLVNENKYLKMENHMLARYKEDVAQLKKENKQISNERDTLKKKIIENVKKEALRMKKFEDSDSQSMNSLSDLTYSITHLKN